MDKRPVFSIITVVFNGLSEIERTVSSCVSQDYPQMEYIVIDGGSTDGTIEVLHRYRSKISTLIIEKDNGIYDAMNKGIKYATGDYVLFMNCSDRFHHANTLTTLANFLYECKPWPDVLYGDAIYCYPNATLLKKPMPLKKMKREMAVCHQATLVKKDLIKDRHFNQKFRLAADYDMMHELYFKGYSFQYAPICIADCNQEEGSTFSNYRLSTIERFSIQNDSGQLLNWIILNKTLLRMDLVVFIKRLIPVKLTQTIFKRKHMNRLIQ